MILPIPNIKKECSQCYQLLTMTHWSIDTDVNPVYRIGSNIPAIIQTGQTNLTTIGICYNCQCEVTRQYIDIDGRFILRMENYHSVNNFSQPDHVLL